jgi:EAL domain-containing protein (putative c-di-GMP-specific phosphodiesterase class I)
MADVRMTASERAWLTWGRSGGPAVGGQRRVRPPISPRHPAAGWLAGELERAAAAPAGLTLVYQPIFDLDSERVVGVEALARLARVPELPAACWLAQASAMGLGTDVELAVLRRVLLDLPGVPSPISVAVNLSAETLVDRRCPSLVRRVGHHARRLVVEIDAFEPTPWSVLDHALAGLRRLGVRVAVDDGVLRELPALLPDVVKLDPTVVRSIDSEPLRQALAATIMRLAADLGATVCAEAIETAAELDELRRLGVPNGQGFHLGRPASLPWTIGALVGDPGAAAVFN